MSIRGLLTRNRFVLGFFTGILLAGTAAVGANVLNTPEGGYLFCINKGTKAVTYPAAQKCPSGFSRLIAGMQGARGETGPQGEVGPQGLIGPSGIQGADGKDGKEGPAGKDGLPGMSGGSGSTGPAGPAGSPGLFKLYDSSNTLVGSLLGVSNFGTTFDVLTPGGLHQSYDISGVIAQSGLEIWFADSNCSGTAFVETKSLHRYLGDGYVDFNQRMFSATKPIVALKGVPYFNQTNNFSVDRVFIPASESSTVATIYTPMNYLDNTQRALGCYELSATNPDNPFGVNTHFDVTELTNFTGSLRLRFDGPLIVR